MYIEKKLIIIFFTLIFLYACSNSAKNNVELPSHSTQHFPRQNSISTLQQTTQHIHKSGPATISSPTSKSAEVPENPDQKLSAASPEPENPMPGEPAKEKEADGLYEKGFQAYMSRKFDEAIKLFDKALQLDPKCYKAYNGKGIALCFKGSSKEGISFISRALEINPGYPYANFNMALAYKLKKDYDNSLVWFHKTISLDPENTWSHFGMACIYAERNVKDKALECLRRAIETDPDVKEIAKNEHDLDNIKNTKEFIEMVN